MPNNPIPQWIKYFTHLRYITVLMASGSSLLNKARVWWTYMEIKWILWAVLRIDQPVCQQPRKDNLLPPSSTCLRLLPIRGMSMEVTRRKQLAQLVHVLEARFLRAIVSLSPKQTLRIHIRRGNVLVLQVFLITAHPFSFTPYNNLEAPTSRGFTILSSSLRRKLKTLFPRLAETS